MELELEKFIAAKTGVPNVGDTKENRGECVGLIEVWLDTLHFPHIWGNAIDLLDNADPNFYDVVLNDPYNYPVEGDIVVLGEPFGQYIDPKDNKVHYFGHTGIVVRADINTVTLFEQNSPAGSTPRIVQHSYNPVKGWIRLKQTAVQPQPTVPPLPSASSDGDKVYTQAQYDACITDRKKFWQERDALQEQLDVVNAKYAAFVTLGYTTVEDVTRALKVKDDKYLQLQQDQIIIEKKNETLANLLGDDSKKNYEAMADAHQKADKLTELENGVTELAKELKVDKPTITNIFSRVTFFMGLAEKYIRGKEYEVRQKEAANAAKTAVQVQTSSILKSMFNL